MLLYEIAIEHYNSFRGLSFFLGTDENGIAVLVLMPHSESDGTMYFEDKLTVLTPKKLDELIEKIVKAYQLEKYEVRLAPCYPDKVQPVVNYPCYGAKEWIGDETWAAPLPDNPAYFGICSMTDAINADFPMEWN